MESIKVSMNEKRLVISLNGQINAATVDGLIKELNVGFDYYQYPAITVRLDSPGGDYTSMRTLMNAINVHHLANQHIHVHAAQICASAAALILAHGAWGTRTVEPHTTLLFHWARASLEVGQVITSDMASSLAKGLSTADQKVLEQLVCSMSGGAGSNIVLVRTMSKRLDEVLVNWCEISRTSQNHTEAKSVKQPVWLKALQRQIKRWTAETDERKRTAAIVSCLKARFELDSIMDLREAYVLCLIDVVSGVLPRITSVIDSRIAIQKINSVATERSQVSEFTPKPEVNNEGQMPSLSSQRTGTFDRGSNASKYSERIEA